MQLTHCGLPRMMHEPMHDRPQFLAESHQLGEGWCLGFGLGHSAQPFLEGVLLVMQDREVSVHILTRSGCRGRLLHLNQKIGQRRQAGRSLGLYQVLPGAGMHERPAALQQHQRHAYGDERHERAHTSPQKTAVTISRRLRCMSASSVIGRMIVASHAAWGWTPLLINWPAE